MALTIHLGAHKTASTHLQQTLGGLVPQMLSAGIHYSGPQHWRDGVSRWGALRLGVLLGEGPALARQRGRMRWRLDRVADSWPEMVISEENILGSLRRDALMGAGGIIYPAAAPRLRRLMGMLRHRPATLCLAVRDPGDFLTSAFAMQVQGGLELRFEDYLDGFDPPRLSWSGLAERLLGLRGVARLVVWRYEDYAALRPRILRLFMPDAVAVAAGDPRIALPGLSAPAYRALLDAAARQPDPDLGRLAQAAKARFPRGPEAPPLRVIEPDAAALCRASYAADLDRLAALRRVTLLRP